MKKSDVNKELLALVSDEDFASASDALAENWISRGAGIEIVEPILRFMESHPQIDYGTPGALTHFVERFHTRGYEDHLVKSIERRPTRHTVWMLNRVINGTKVGRDKENFASILERARSNPRADQATVEQIDNFLGRNWR